MRWIMVAALSGLAGPVWADAFCDELWLTRNMLFDRAGYCFASPLGQALFGEGDCVDTQITLDPEAAGIVQQVLEWELWADCAVDTSRTTLEVPQLALRLSLIDPPIRDEGESACIGWRGAPMILRAGRSGSARQTGILRTGDTILLSYVEVDGWSFIAAPDGGPDMGWVRLPLIGVNDCDGYAG